MQDNVRKKQQQETPPNLVRVHATAPDRGRSNSGHLRRSPAPAGRPPSSRMQVWTDSPVTPTAELDPMVPRVEKYGSVASRDALRDRSVNIRPTRDVMPNAEASLFDSMASTTAAAAAVSPIPEPVSAPTFDDIPASRLSLPRVHDMTKMSYVPPPSTPSTDPDPSRRTPAENRVPASASPYASRSEPGRQQRQALPSPASDNARDYNTETMTFEYRKSSKLAPVAPQRRVAEAEPGLQVDDLAASFDEPFQPHIHGPRLGRAPVCLAIPDAEQRPISTFADPYTAFSPPMLAGTGLVALTGALGGRPISGAGVIPVPPPGRPGDSRGNEVSGNPRPQQNTAQFNHGAGYDHSAPYLGRNGNPGVSAAATSEDPQRSSGATPSSPLVRQADLPTGSEIRAATEAPLPETANDRITSTVRRRLSIQSKNRKEFKVTDYEDVVREGRDSPHNIIGRLRRGKEGAVADYEEVEDDGARISKRLVAMARAARLSPQIARPVFKGLVSAATSLVNQAGEFHNDVGTIESSLDAVANKVAQIRSQVPDSKGQIARVRSQFASNDLFIRRDALRTLLSNVPSGFRWKTGNVVLQILHLLRSTSCEALSVEMEKAIPDDLDETQSYMSTYRKMFAKSDSETDVAQKVVDFESKERIFSGIHHLCEERLVFHIEAWAPEEEDLNRLAETTGALYYFGSVLASSVADPRGCYMQLREGGNGKLHAAGSQRNCAVVYVGYAWPSPEKLSSFDVLVHQVQMGDKGATQVLEEAVKSRAERQKSKNIYLLGQTGEGKSTLGNCLVGMDVFSVSDAGTGTYEISGEVAQLGGAIQNEDQVVVWDTPGMNDQDGLDYIFENKMYRHLTREQTVSCIFIVSRDGARFPGTLRQMIDVYKKAFGPSFTTCVSVLIGMQYDSISAEARRMKRRFWVRSMSQELDHKLPPDRIFFFDPRISSPQKEMERINDLISGADIHLTGTGDTIYRGLLDLRVESDEVKVEERKKRMRGATAVVVDSLQEDLNGDCRLRVKYYKQRDELVVSYMLPVGEDILRIMRLGGKAWRRAADQKRKEYRFKGEGRNARRLMSNVAQGMPEKNGQEKFRALLSGVQRNRIVLSRMESETETGTMRRQVVNFVIIDLDDQITQTVYRRIEAILMELVKRRHEAEPLVDEIVLAADRLSTGV